MINYNLDRLSSVSVSSRQNAIIGLLLFLLVLTWGQGMWLPEDPSVYGRTMTGTITKDQSKKSIIPDNDVVISLYNEDLATMAETVDRVKFRLKGTTRVIVYSKAERNASEINQILEIANEVIPLPNIGREGETYLHHITRHYHRAESDLADHTLFLQPHLAWHWIFLPRVEAIRKETGFMSFGPYRQKNCTVDSQGLGFPRMADIYSAFQGDMCPPGPHLSTWAGQFVVSRKRILDNPLRNYQNLLDKFHAPPEHWIWKESWWNHGPSNPTLGHILERSWPVIFDCTDANMTETCKTAEIECQCLD